MRRTFTALVVLVAALIAWTLLASMHTDGSDAQGTVATVLLASLAFGAGTLLHRLTAAVAVTVMLATAAALYLGDSILSRSPLADPLHYANANGALYVQVAALAGIAATRVRSRTVKGLFVLAGLAFSSLPFRVGSAAASATAVAVALAVVVASTGRPAKLSKWTTSVAGLLVLLAAGSTVMLAEHYGNGSPDDYCYRCTEDEGVSQPPVLAALSERRIELWRDAERLAREDPIFGVGPGRFDEVSEIAKFDRDTRAAHSALLEQAAETGLPGALLLLALGLVVLVAIRCGSGTGFVALAAWTAFCLHAQIDYVADFPVLVALAALVAGLGTAATTSHRTADEVSPGRRRHRRRAGAGESRR